jgi:hypothetical protein
MRLPYILPFIVFSVGCQEVNYVAGELDINNSCSPRSGTFVITYDKISGNCSDKPDEVRKFDSDQRLEDMEVSNDLCHLSGKLPEKTEIKYVQFQFNEDWSYGDGTIIVERNDCKSVYNSTIQYLVW